MWNGYISSQNLSTTSRFGKPSNALTTSKNKLAWRLFNDSSKLSLISVRVKLGLHIKLGLIKKFGKSYKQRWRGIETPERYIFKSIYTIIMVVKLKEGVFIGHQIRTIFKDQLLKSKLVKKERRAWAVFETFVKKKFFFNIRTINYKGLV